MKYLIFIATLLAGVTTVKGQIVFKGEKLGPEINTLYDETCIRLSPDGKTMYFVRDQFPQNIGGRGGGQDIWYSTLDSQKNWTAAKNLGNPVNNYLHNSIGGVGRYGNEVYVTNVYPEGDIHAGPGISVSKRNGGSWSTPIPVMTSDQVGTLSPYMAFYVTPDQKVMIISMTPEGGRAEDLYVSFSKSSDLWSDPKPLGNVINSDGFETAPFVSKDSKRLFFTSNGHGGEGKGDIYFSDRLDDTWTNWTEPVNLGIEVNTPGFDGFFVTDPAEEFGYFISGETPTSLGDIYRVKLDEVEALNDKGLFEDTLRIFTREDQPLPVDLAPFGINSQKGYMVSSRSVNGKGSIQVYSKPPYFVYHPTRDFSGLEMLKVSYCDPPHSDNCKMVVVLAQVDQSDENIKPEIPGIFVSTVKNTPVKIDLPENKLGTIDYILSQNLHDNSKGSIFPNSETQGEHFIYKPAQGFTGKDTLHLFNHCGNPDKWSCLGAVVYVDVKAPDVVYYEIETKDSTNHGGGTEINTEGYPNPDKEIIVEGKIKNIDTGIPMSVEIVFVDAGGHAAPVTISSERDGTFQARLQPKHTWELKINYKGFEPYATKIQSNVNNSTSLNIYLRREKEQEIVITDASSTEIETIVFDLKKAFLNTAEKDKLRKVYDYMKRNPKASLEIIGYSNDYKSDGANEKLALTRSNSVINYLKYLGIMGNRMSASTEAAPESGEYQKAILKISK